MAEFVTLGARPAMELEPQPNHRLRVTHAGGSILYFGDVSLVPGVVYQGLLTAGQTTTLSGRKSFQTESGSATVSMVNVAISDVRSTATVANEVPNPRGTTTLGWGYSVPDGDVAAPPLIVVEGGGVELSFTPDATEQSGLLRAATNTAYTQAAAASARWPDIVFGRMKARITEGSVGAGLELAMGCYAIDDTFVTERPLDAILNAEHGVWHELSGFGLAGVDAHYVNIGVRMTGTTIDSKLQGKDALISVNAPSGAVEYFDGEDGQWLGARDLSRSTAEVDVSPANDGFLFGFNDNSLAGFVLSLADEIDLYEEIGANCLRATIDMRGTTQPSAGATLNFASGYLAIFAALYDACVAAGITPIFTVLYCPTYMGVAAGFAPPDATARTQWAAMCTQIAVRFPDAVIEVWNEPNLGGIFWQPDSHPVHYTDLLTKCYDSIKAVNPSQTVLLGGVNGSVTSDATTDAIDVFLAGIYAAGAKGKFDGLSFHNSAYDGFNSGRNFTEVMQMVRGAAEDAGDSVPLWITESSISTGTTDVPVGITAATEEQQALVHRLTYGLLKTQPDVHAFLIHTLVSPSAFAQTSYTAGEELVERTTMRRKPAFLALKAERAAE